MMGLLERGLLIGGGAIAFWMLLVPLVLLVAVCLLYLLLEQTGRRGSGDVS